MWGFWVFTRVGGALRSVLCSISGYSWWEDNLAVTSLAWRKGRGRPRKIRNSSTSFLLTASAVGGQFRSSLDFAAAARVAVFAGLTISARTWREASLLNPKNNWLSIFMPASAIGLFLYLISFTVPHLIICIIQTHVLWWNSFITEITFGVWILIFLLLSVNDLKVFGAAFSNKWKEWKTFYIGNN